MSFLSEYLQRRREARETEEAKRDLDDASPEKILEALQANTEYTADLVGTRSKEAHQQNKNVLDSLEVVAHGLDSLQPETEQVAVRIQQSTDAEQRASKVTNSNLAEINKTLKDLAATNRLVEKHLRPELNSKDDTYASKEEKAAQATGGKSAKEREEERNKKAEPSGLGALIADGLDMVLGGAGAGKGTPKGGTGGAGGAGAGAGAGKGRGRFGKFMYNTGRVLGSITGKVGRAAGTVISKTPLVAKATLAGVGGVAAADLATPEVKAAQVAEEGGVKAKPTSYVERAKEAVKPAVTKAAEFTEKVKEAAKPALESTKEGAKKAFSWVKSTGSDLIGKFKEAPKAEAVAGEVGKSSSVAAETASAVKPSMLGKLGNLLGKLATPIAVGFSAKEAYDTEQNDKLTREEKNVEHGKTAGGLAGGLAGAQAGAAFGATVGSVVPGAGTAIGGVLGGIGGGVAGYFGGSKLGEKVMGGVNTLNAAIPENFKDKIGAAVALAISPFSQDARDALKTDFKPELEKASSKFNDASIKVSDSLGETAKTFSSTFADLTKKLTDSWDATKDTAQSVWIGTKQAAKTAQEAASTVSKGISEGAKEGYKKEGVMGALKGAVSGGRTAYAKASEDLAKDISVSKGIAVGRFNEAEQKVLGEAQSAGEKFRGGQGLTKETKDMITRVATEKGIDPRDLLSMAQMESGGNAKAVSATGAAGLFQFTSGTARDMKLTNRFDPEANTRAAADLYLKNKATLEARGEKATVDNLYLAHQQGAGGAVSILKAARGEGTLDETIQRNMGLNVGGNAGGATVAEKAARFIAANKQALASAGTKAEKVTLADNAYVKTPTDLAMKVTPQPTKAAEPATALAQAAPTPKPQPVPTPQPVPKPVEVAKTEPAKPVPVVAKAEVSPAKPEVKEVGAGILLAEATERPEVSPAVSKKVETLAMGSVVPEIASPKFDSLNYKSLATLAQDPELAQMSRDPRFQSMLQNPAVSTLAARGDIEGLLATPEVQSMPLPGEDSTYLLGKLVQTVDNIAKKIGADKGKGKGGLGGAIADALGGAESALGGSEGGTAGDGAGTASGSLPNLGSLVSGLSGNLSGGLSGLTSSLQSVTGGTANSLASSATNLTSGLNRSVNSLTSGLSSGLGKTTQDLTGNLAGLTSGLGSSTNDIASSFNATTQSLTGNLASTTQGVSRQFSGLDSSVASLGTSFQGAAKNLGGFGDSIGEGLQVASAGLMNSAVTPDLSSLGFGSSPMSSITSARQSPMSLVSQALPEEASPVALTNPGEVGMNVTQSQPTQHVMGSAFDTAVPKLDNIPLQISDLGLVLLNIGHV